MDLKTNLQLKTSFIFVHQIAAMDYAHKNFFSFLFLSVFSFISFFVSVFSS